MNRFYFITVDLSCAFTIEEQQEEEEEENDVDHDENNVDERRRDKRNTYEIYL